MTINEIKLANDTNIRDASGAGSITKTIDANMRDAVANELRDRGVLTVSATSSLASLSHDNSILVLVKEVGVFASLETAAAADNDNTYASADAGWLWEKVLEVNGYKKTGSGNLSVVVKDGNSCWRIKAKSSAADTLKIGTTNGGEEIMPAETLTANVYKTVNCDVDADGSDVTIYFTGLTGTTTVILYKNSI